MKENKSMYNPKKENAIFAKKLRNLFDKCDVTQKALADYILEETGESITRQSVGQWCLGNTCPPLRTIPVIAKFFGVSTDYLLTETDIQNPEADVISVCGYTGLSEKAVKFLNGLQSRAKGESISPEFVINYATEKHCTEVKRELEKIITEFPKIKATINKFLQCRRNGDLSGADSIITKFGDSEEYKEAFDRAKVMLMYENLIEDRKKSSVKKSQLALKAISELLSASDHEMFVTNLTLLFSCFDENFKRREITIDSVADIYDVYEQTIKLPEKIIETVLLNEILTYIKGIKEEVYNRETATHAFYSFSVEKCDKKEEDTDNG